MLLVFPIGRPDENGQVEEVVFQDQGKTGQPAGFQAQIYLVYLVYLVCRVYLGHLNRDTG